MPGAPWKTGNGDPYKRLLSAIILRAIDDCNGKDEMRAMHALWFLYSPTCEFFCESLGNDLEKLSTLRDALATSWGWEPDDFSHYQR